MGVLSMPSPFGDFVFLPAQVTAVASHARILAEWSDEEDAQEGDEWQPPPAETIS